ncbi:inosine/xanthosine triphosphatase [Marinomonas sp. 5E14-1]|uniref:inosine/xanthosine triphosphatase n=1 Tax=Marinomonas sp. 5E14-1 TaxID=3153922 RepID=UPI003263CBC9
MITDTTHIIVGSQNPVKINAAKQAFNTVFKDSIIECVGQAAPSGVREQPLTEAETRLGAQNRALYCHSNHTSEFNNAFFVAMEGGVDKFEEGAATFAYVAIVDSKGKLFTGRSANLPLPNNIYQRLLKGEELGPIMDELFHTSNIRQKSGAIGLLTNNAATRESIYTQALILALAPILHPTHF